jgi:hypothetical protein
VSAGPGIAVRRAELADAAAIGRLPHDFNSEFDEPTPGPRAVAERVRALLAAGEMTVLLGGAGPDGLAVNGFSNRDGASEGPVNYFYEREL